MVNGLCRAPPVSVVERIRFLFLERNRKTETADGSVNLALSLVTSQGMLLGHDWVEALPAGR